MRRAVRPALRLPTDVANFFFADSGSGRTMELSAVGAERRASAARYGVFDNRSPDARHCHCGAHVMDRCGIAYTPDEVSRFVGEIERLRPFADVPAALEKLRQEGYQLAILSNGDRDMLEAAKPHIGFTFDHVISVDEAGYFKPHWKNYATAETIIGGDRSTILFVANHAFDCIGAKSYGMRTAFIDRRRWPFGRTPHQPDLIVANFNELALALAPSGASVKGLHLKYELSNSF